MFAKDDLNLGRMSVVKHEIKLEEGTPPLHEQYHHIPPWLYEEVRRHLERCLSEGYKPFNSPWASMVLLVRNKNGKLNFCIDLRKVNSMTRKDAYNTPQVHGTLDCLKGAVWLNCWTWKSGNWQVELNDASNVFTTFTMGPLGFYECKKIPLG